MRNETSMLEDMSKGFQRRTFLKGGLFVLGSLFLPGCGGGSSGYNGSKTAPTPNVPPLDVGEPLYMPLSQIVRNANIVPTDIFVNTEGYQLGQMVRNYASPFGDDGINTLTDGEGSDAPAGYDELGLVVPRLYRGDNINALNLFNSAKEQNLSLDIVGKFLGNNTLDAYLIRLSGESPESYIELNR